MQVNANGAIIKHEVNGSIQMRALLSGMPELKLGLNDKLLLNAAALGPGTSKLIIFKNKPTSTVFSYALKDVLLVDNTDRYLIYFVLFSFCSSDRQLFRIVRVTLYLSSKILLCTQKRTIDVVSKYS